MLSDIHDEWIFPGLNVWCTGASGFKLHLSFLVTIRRTEEKVVAVSSPVAAAPSGWTPVVIQWVSKLHFLISHL